jgi:hypothetical protein
MFVFRGRGEKSKKEGKKMVGRGTWSTGIWRKLKQRRKKVGRLVGMTRGLVSITVTKKLD